MAVGRFGGVSGGGGRALEAGAIGRGALGRWASGDGLTAQQEAFVREYVTNGGNGWKAAEAAGYGAPEQWRRVVVNPAVGAAIDAEVRQTALPVALLALKRLREVVEGEREVSGPYMAALRLGLEVGRVVGRNVRTVADDGGKPIGQMSLDEIRAELARQSDVAPENRRNVTVIEPG